MVLPDVETLKNHPGCPDVSQLAWEPSLSGSAMLRIGKTGEGLKLYALAFDTGTTRSRFVDEAGVVHPIRSIGSAILDEPYRLVNKEWQSLGAGNRLTYYLRWCFYLKGEITEYARPDTPTPWIDIRAALNNVASGGKDTSNKRTAADEGAQGPVKKSKTKKAKTKTKKQGKQGASGATKGIKKYFEAKRDDSVIEDLEELDFDMLFGEENFGNIEVNTGNNYAEYTPAPFLMQQTSIENQARLEREMPQQDLERHYYALVTQNEQLRLADAVRAKDCQVLFRLLYDEYQRMGSGAADRMRGLVDLALGGRLKEILGED